MSLRSIEQKVIELCQRYYLPAARLALFVIYFWFGLLKLVNASPAFQLAQALTAKTIGAEHFMLLFKILAVYECALGVLFLFPRLLRWAVGLFAIHMVIVCSPLILVPHLAWMKPLAPTLEGQYIIKNLALIALVIVLIANFKSQTQKN